MHDGGERGCVVGGRWCAWWVRSVGTAGVSASVSTQQLSSQRDEVGNLGAPGRGAAAAGVREEEGGGERLW